ncbi:MAG: nickel ABC transporter permease [Bacillota bacterium]
MFRYVVKRIIMLVPIIIGVSFLVFFIMSLTPGDPVKMKLGMEASEEAIKALRSEMGLDDPVFIQYVRYMGKVIKGDMGRSYTTNRLVFKEIMARYPATFRLTFFSILVAVLISIPVGITSATKQYSLIDSISMLAALLGASVPNFWFGLMLILLFALNWRLLPSGGANTWHSIILPSITLGTTAAAIITRMTRSSMLEVIRQDYIRMARAKGVREKVVIRKHALKNALIPVVTVVGLQFGTLLGGAVLTETVFSWPGIGRLMVEAIRAKDTPMVLGCIIIFAITFSIINLLIDILYAYIDPRIKSQYS